MADEEHDADQQHEAVNSELERAVKDVVPLIQLSSPIPTKEYILGYLLGMTGTDEGTCVICHNHSLIAALKAMFCESEESTKVKIDCLNMLVNSTSMQGVSTDADCPFACLLHKDSLHSLFSSALERDSPLADAAAMLLTNLSLTTENAHELQAFVALNEDVASVKQIVEAFCQEKYNPGCHLHHVGSLLANLTQLKNIRNELLLRDCDYIQRIIPFTRYEASVVRRVSAARIIRNCAFDTDAHEWLLGPDVDLLPSLLLPLAGGEEFRDDEMEKLPLDLQYLPADKKREKDCEVVVLLLETILRLCCTKPCRLQIKDSGAYYIIREMLYKVSEDVSPENMTHMDTNKDEGRTISGDISQSKMVYEKLESLVTMLLNDEPEDGKDNFLEYDIPENIHQQLNAIDKQIPTQLEE